ncbi:hypothetical protein [Endozoicomonas atrinae]|uniref:hypothetical protein n=1 Tax=Endozoicomonas atrinae TaxID=1333660 RepID=UPI003AFFE50C
MEKAWAIIIDDDQAACMMAIPRLFEQLLHQHYMHTYQRIQFRIKAVSIAFHITLWPKVLECC